MLGRQAGQPSRAFLSLVGMIPQQGFSPAVTAPERHQTCPRSTHLHISTVPCTPQPCCPPLAPGAAPYSLLHGHRGFHLLGIEKSVQRHRYENPGSNEPQQDESTSPCSGNVPTQQRESSCFMFLREGILANTDVH